MGDHPNAAFVRQAYDAMARGDMAWLESHTDPDVVFFQGGRFPTAGTFEGRDALFSHFGAFMDLVQGNFAIAVHDILANDDHTTALIRVTVGRDGKSLEFNEVHVFHIEDGRMTRMWAIPEDPYVVDAFLS